MMLILIYVRHGLDVDVLKVRYKSGPASMAVAECGKDQSKVSVVRQTQVQDLHAWGIGQRNGFTGKSVVVKRNC